jgi:hypothetical protein
MNANGICVNDNVVNGISVNDNVVNGIRLYKSRTGFISVNIIMLKALLLVSLD